MSYDRCPWLACAAVALLLSAAPAQQPPPAPSAQQPPAPPPPKPDPEAVKTFNRALEKFGPQRGGWLKTTLWQQVDVQGLAFHSEGLYLSGPDHRLHLDLNVRVGSTEGRLQIVSDGSTLWQAVRVGGGERVVSKYELKKVLEVLNTPGTVLVFTRQDPGQWKGHKALVLTGVWNGAITNDILKKVGILDRWPATLPRKCVVYLDAQSLWPLRLEWRGGPPKGEEAALLQMEFRDPQLLGSGDKPPAEYAGLFVFDERNQKVIDQTREMTEGLRARARELAIQTKPNPPGQPAPPTSR
jgi:hypothetical protein